MSHEKKLFSQRKRRLSLTEATGFTERKERKCGLKFLRLGKNFKPLPFSVRKTHAETGESRADAAGIYLAAKKYQTHSPSVLSVSSSEL